MVKNNVGQKLSMGPMILFLSDTGISGDLRTGIGYLAGYLI